MESEPESEQPPLIPSRGLRTLIALGIVLTGILTALAGTILLLVLWVPTGLSVAAGATVLACGVLTAFVVEVGVWTRGVLGRVQRGAVALALLGAVAVFLAGAIRGAGLLLELPAYGTPPSRAVLSFVVAAFGALAFAVLLAASPPLGSAARRSRPRLRRASAGAAVVGGIMAVGAVAAAAAPSGCGMFEFQPERWRSELADPGSGRLTRMADAVRRCGVVTPGMTRAQVRARLGRPSSAADGTWSWDLDDGSGFLALPTWLSVDFERQDGVPRVSSVTVPVD